MFRGDSLDGEGDDPARPVGRFLICFLFEPAHGLGRVHPGFVLHRPHQLGLCLFGSEAGNPLEARPLLGGGSCEGVLLQG